MDLKVEMNILNNLIKPENAWCNRQRTTAMGSPRLFLSLVTRNILGHIPAVINQRVLVREFHHTVE